MRLYASSLLCLPARHCTLVLSAKHTSLARWLRVQREASSNMDSTVHRPARVRHQMCVFILVCCRRGSRYWRLRQPVCPDRVPCCVPIGCCYQTVGLACFLLRCALVFVLCGLPAQPDAQCTWQLPQDVFLLCPTCSVLVQIRIPGIAGVEHPWMTAYAVDMRYSICSKHT